MATTIPSASNSNLHPADMSSPFANVLLDCIRASTDGSYNFCTLAKLPYLGQYGRTPNKQEILARLVVSHDWMTKRFADLLDKMPADMFKLFASVTAVVIDPSINRSFYNPKTAVIYLDPSYLATTDEERANGGTSSKPQPAYLRADYPLRFQPVTVWLDTSGRTGLTSEQQAQETYIIKFAQVMFHELAHAADTMPINQVYLANPSLTIPEQITLNKSQGMYNDRVANIYPLTSTILPGVAQVYYENMPATSTQQALTTEQVIQAFSNDGATDLYSFENDKEDVAVLFDTVMTKYHFNLDKVISFSDWTTAPTNRDCNDFIVRWGEVNRIASPTVKKRAQLAVQKLLGITDSSAYFKDLSQAKPLQTGVNICVALQQAYPKGFRLH